MEPGRFTIGQIQFIPWSSVRQFSRFTTTALLEVTRLLFHFWGAILTTQHFTATPFLFRFLWLLCCLPFCLVLRILWGIKSVLCSFSVFWVRGLFRLCFFLKASIHFGLVLSLWFWRALAFGVVWCFTMLTSRKLPTQKITTK